MADHAQVWLSTNVGQHHADNWSQDVISGKLTESVIFRKISETPATIGNPRVQPLPTTTSLSRKCPWDLEKFRPLFYMGSGT